MSLESSSTMFSALILMDSMALDYEKAYNGDQTMSSKGGNPSKQSTAQESERRLQGKFDEKKERKN